MAGKATTPAPKTIPATCVLLPGGVGGVLLMGRSGAGKSDLALRLIAQHGGVLVADDQVVTVAKDKKLLASAPPPLKGLLEVRGIGILKLPYRANVPVSLAVELLGASHEVERLPKPEHFEILGVLLPLIRLCALEASASSKIVAALAALRDGTMATGAFKG